MPSPSWSRCTLGCCVCASLSYCRRLRSESIKSQSCSNSRAQRSLRYSRDFVPHHAPSSNSTGYIAYTLLGENGATHYINFVVLFGANIVPCLRTNLDCNTAIYCCCTCDACLCSCVAEWPRKLKCPISATRGFPSQVLQTRPPEVPSNVDGTPGP